MRLSWKTVCERNIWLKIGDFGQIKMVLFREVGVGKCEKCIEWVEIYTEDVSQNGCFRGNESKKGTFG